jgi:hypothetical protein
MPVIKLKPGEVVIVSAGDPSRPDNTLPGQQPGVDNTLPGQEQPVDPGYGVDLGLGWLRPSQPIYNPARPDNTLPLPPTGPVDPSWGIDADIGYERPTNPIYNPARPDNTLPGGQGGQVDNTLPEVPVPELPDVEWEIKTAWTPATGWIVVAVPTGETVTPSKRK